MIFAFSTSSPSVSVAVFSQDGDLLFSGTKEAQNKASGGCIALLEEAGYDVLNGTLFLADIGPGSFTGTRVGVTLAKTLAWTASAQCGAATSFDLISPKGTVVLPSKRGEWFIRPPGETPYRSEELPKKDFIGFGPGIEAPVLPSAQQFQALLNQIIRVTPEALMPSYLIEPSISIPKKRMGQS